MAVLEKFKRCNMLNMRKELIEELLNIHEVVGIIKNWVLSRMSEIDHMVNMAHRNDIILDVVNNLPIMQDERKKRYQTSNYKIMNIGAYYLHNYWDNTHKVTNKVAFLALCMGDMDVISS